MSPPPTSASARTVQIDDVAMRFLVAGSGPAVVLLHGLGDSALDWEWVLPTLASGYRVYVPDLVGTGGSDAPEADYTPAFLTRYVSRFLEVLGLERAALIGHSLGGLIALRLALEHDPRVSALGLMASAGLGREVARGMRVNSLPGVGEAAIAWARTPPGALQRALSKAALLFARPHHVAPRWLAEQVGLTRKPGFLRAMLSSLRGVVGPLGQREVWLDALPQVHLPTLVLWGRSDRVVPEAHAHEAVRRLPHATLALLPRCGHLPQVEQPGACADALRGFLAAHAGHPGRIEARSSAAAP